MRRIKVHIWVKVGSRGNMSWGGIQRKHELRWDHELRGTWVEVGSRGNMSWGGIEREHELRWDREETWVEVGSRGNMSWGGINGFKVANYFKFKENKNRRSWDILRWEGWTLKLSFLCSVADWEETWIEVGIMRRVKVGSRGHELRWDPEGTWVEVGSRGNMSWGGIQRKHELRWNMNWEETWVEVGSRGNMSWGQEEHELRSKGNMSWGGIKREHELRWDREETWEVGRKHELRLDQEGTWVEVGSRGNMSWGGSKGKWVKVGSRGNMSWGGIKREHELRVGSRENMNWGGIKRKHELRWDPEETWVEVDQEGTWVEVGEREHDLRLDQNQLEMTFKREFRSDHEINGSCGQPSSGGSYRTKQGRLKL